MSDVVLIAIVGLVGIIGTGIISPLVLGWLNAKSRIREKEEDAENADSARRAEWKRQDEVADRAALVAQAASQAATAAAEAVKHVADLAKQARIDAAADAKTMIGKIDVVHTLVNSQMTSAMQAEYDATVRELALMVEVGEMRHVAHPGVATPAVDRAIALTKDRLVVLADALAIRHTAAETVALQEKAAVAAGLGEPGDEKPL